MEHVTRVQISRELARLVEALGANTLTGCLVIAVHANGSETAIVAPPSDPAHLATLLNAVDKMHFRMQVMCYLGPRERPKGDA